MLRLGLQLYTVRDSCEKDFRGALEEVARIGYRWVELAGLHGWTVDKVKEMLTDLGLEAASAHVPIEELRTRFPDVMAAARALNCQFVTIPAPPQTMGQSLGEWKFFREELRFYADQSARMGVTLCYHNHAREFEPLGEGKCAFDVLFEKEEPYRAQLDVYWVAYAGRSPTEEIRRLGRQCASLHLKDLSRCEERSDEIVGEGVLDWGGIFEAARQADITWGFVEQDNPPSPSLSSARKSYEFLVRKFGTFLG